MTATLQSTAEEQSAWLERARLGDTRAFERIYREHSSRVYGLCLRLTRDPSVAEDCTQETFINAWRNLPTFEGRSALGTWLHRIAVNASLARARRGSLEIVPQPSGEDEQPYEGEAPDETPPLDVEAAVGSLPEGARHVLVLYGIYGYTHEEAAGMLGIAVGTCKAQLHRARRLLRERLNG
ncbi:MAG: sigma-70 family RNA polymerase sigma factor [Gammaproteobacteria bacterium]|nr:sigma-70 family RNA polymerase sigma factor [Gammaproteobacteria bacterium]